MSCWCHVAAVMRIDAIRVDDYYEEPDWDELIGKECLWESGDDIWNDMKLNPERYLPMGSEGSLQKSIWVNPDLSHCAAYVVTIFGDLRDCDDGDADKIIEWFKNKCKQFSIRQAMITVNYGYGKTNWVYEGE